MKIFRNLTLPVLAATGGMVLAQAQCPEPGGIYPSSPLTYPMTSDRYLVQYQLGNSGTWVNAQVYITYYGGTDASPYRNPSAYPPDESMSFVSIPAAANTAVAVRVSKIFGASFPAIGQMSVRPTAKGIQLISVNATTVQLSTTTAAGFAGDQFVLWWNGTATESSAIQGLGIFLDPPYTRPAGSKVKVVSGPADLTSLTAYDTLDIEGFVAVAGTGDQPFTVPANIANIFLAPGAWLQGKLLFTQTGAGSTRKLYGPGVLDASRFNYANRQCGGTPDGYQSISWIPLPPGPGQPDSFVVDGPIVTDSNFYATAQFNKGVVNNMKIIGWNGNNDGLQLGFTAAVSNVFVRTADDSLKMWGSSITVTNATVWQGWNGGVVNLGWDDVAHGDDCLIDGLYVVKTDWSLPNTPSWTSTGLNSDNDAIVASMMTPTVKFGQILPSVYRNIYVEDAPHVLLDLKINPFKCSPSCASGPSVLNLNLESVFTPPSTLQNSIGFQNVPVNGAPITGSMNIALTNVRLTMPSGPPTLLTAANAGGVGNISTMGGNISIAYPPTPSTMLLSVSPNPAVAGQTVTLKASLTPAATTGTVNFFDVSSSRNPAALGAATLSAGTATVTTQALAPGIHPLAASYSGDANHGPNLAGINLTVNPAPTTTTLSAAPTSPAAGQAVALTAVVAPTAATGTVTFQDGGTTIGSATLSGGSAGLTTSTLAVGTHSLTAVYGGDANDAPSTSTPVPVTVHTPTCSFTLSSQSASLSQGGTASAGGLQPEVAVTVGIAASNCTGTYTVTSSASWLSGTGGTSSFTYTALSNPHPSPRSATLTVTNASGGSAVFTVTEAGDPQPLLNRQVRALYQSVLGRDPDAAGFAFWTGSGSAGLGQMLDSFLTSPEAYNRDMSVMAAYQAATGAPPSYGQFIPQAAGSLFTSLALPGYTAQNLYLNLLQRPPTPSEVNSANAAGLASWFQTLIAYPSNITPVSAPNNEFMNTGTFHTAQDHSNGLYIAMLYYVILGRDLDPAGFNFWVGIANSGGPGLLFQGPAGYPTRIQILGPGTPGQGFAGSPEFQGLYQ